MKTNKDKNKKETKDKTIAELQSDIDLFIDILSYENLISKYFHENGNMRKEMIMEIWNDKE